MGRLRIKNTNESRKQKATAVKQDCFVKKNGSKNHAKTNTPTSRPRDKKKHTALIINNIHFSSHTLRGHDGH